MDVTPTVYMRSKRFEASLKDMDDFLRTGSFIRDIVVFDMKTMNRE